MTLFNLGSENPLIRRVRRHRTVATLFRRAPQRDVRRSTSPRTPERLEEAPEPAHEPAAPVVQASVGSSVRESAPRPAPVTPREAPAAEPRRAPEAQADGASRSEVSSAPQSRPDEPVEPVEEEASTLTDGVWRRLQTIFNRHQTSERMGTDEPTAEIPPDIEPAAETQPTDEGSPGSVPPAAEPEAPEATPAVPAETPTVQREVTPTSAQTKEGDQIGREAPRVPSSAPTIEESPQRTDLREVAETRDLPQDTRQVAQSGETETQTEPVPSPPEPEGTEPPQPRSRAAGAPTEDRSIETGAPPSVEEATEGELGLEDVMRSQKPTESPSGPPLQDVDTWEVQTAQPARRPPELRAMAEQDAAVGAETAPHVERVMRQAASERPTRSSIEVIQPRRPRPKAPPEPPTSTSEERRIPPDKPAAVASRETDGAERSPDKREESAGLRIDRMAEPDPQDTDATTAKAPPHPSAPEREPPMVPTEIGPLPSDLWDLIGEPPPTAEESVTEENGSAEREAAPPFERPPRPAGPAAQRMPDRAVHQPESGPAFVPPPPVIQRAVAPEATSSETEPSTEGEEGTELDIEALARRVYSEVRRRLATELERMRTRF